MTDRIELKGIRVFARHGVLPDERASGQVFEIDVMVHVDLEEAGRTDSLDATVDYGTLAVRVHDVVAGERWHLIERVAERVAEVALEDMRVEQVDVTVHKPEAPITVSFQDVAVSITRRRS